MDPVAPRTFVVTLLISVSAALGCDGKAAPVTAMGGSGGAMAGAGASSGTGGSVAASGNGNTAGTTGGSLSDAGQGTGGSSGSGGSGGGAPQPWVPAFTTRTLSAEFMAEGAAIGDIDGDGAVDVWSGPRWYAGPDFERGGNLFADQVFPLTDYSKHFLAFLDDLDGDQDLDGIMYGFPGEDVRWYENPGKAGLGANWAAHVMVATAVGNESPTYANLMGDARRELVFMSGDSIGYATPGAAPTDVWTYHSIDEDQGFDRYTHGLGVADVNGDDRPDIVERGGVWLQPASGTTWEHQAVDFALGGRGGAQMLVNDVDGDGDQDVVTSLDAHGYGLAWFEQTAKEPLTFASHQILSQQAGAENFSQLHALAAADLNGDGLLDFVTGKRYYAHAPPTDPGGTDPAVLYWFELSREGGVAFEPHQIHADSGVGTSFEIGDLNADGKPDIAITNKKGTFLHVQQ